MAMWMMRGRQGLHDRMPYPPVLRRRADPLHGIYTGFLVMPRSVSSHLGRTAAPNLMPGERTTDFNHAWLPTLGKLAGSNGPRALKLTDQIKELAPARDST
jgi:hypothetical protein